MGSFFSKSNKTSDDDKNNKGRVLFDEYVNTDRFHDLSDKVVAITGTSANSLGFYLAEIAIRKHAKVLLLLNRDSKASQQGQEKLERILQEKPQFETNIQSITCDLMDFDSVRKAAERVKTIVKEYGGLDVLINNAGIMAQADKRTEAGFDIQMQTNQLSHFLLAKLVFPSLELAAETRGEARLVAHSSGARFFPNKNLEHKYFTKCEAGTLGGNHMFWDFLGRGGPWTRYHMTKLANSCFAMAMHHRLQAKHSKVMALAADPGVASSGLYGNATSGSGAMSGFLARLIIGTGQSSADGSLSAAMCAFSPQSLSGDLWMPKQQQKGPPIKAIEEASDVDGKAAEKLTLTKSNQENVWTWCEEAVGEKFEI